MISEKEINEVEVTIEDLLYVSEEVHKRPEKDRDWEGRMILMTRLFSGEPEKSMAIDYRLSALSEIIASNQLPHWALPTTEEGAVNIAEPVFLAAATEPLIFQDNEVYFDAGSFINRVLALAEPEGSA